MAKQTKKDDDKPRPVTVSLRGKPRVLRLRDGRKVTVTKRNRAVEIDGLDVEGFGSSDKKPC